MIGVKGGEKTCAPAVTRRKDIGRIDSSSNIFPAGKACSVRPRRSLRRGDSRTARGKRPSVSASLR